MSPTFYSLEAASGQREPPPAGDDATAGKEATEAETPAAADDLFWYKVLITLISLAVLICFAINSGMESTSILDQMVRVGASMEELGLMLSVCAFVSLLTTLLHGVLIEMMRRHMLLLMGVYVAVFAALYTLNRFHTSFPAFFTISVISSFFYTNIDTFMNVIMLRIWEKSASTPLYVVQTGWGIGSMIGPLLMRPFLSPDGGDDVHNDTVTTGGPPLPMTAEDPSSRYPDGSSLQIPFAISGTLLILAGCSLVFLHFKVNPLKDASGPAMKKEKQRFIDVINPATCAHKSTLAAIAFLAGFLLYYFMMMSNWYGMSVYLFPYLVESDLGFSKNDAAAIQSVYSGMSLLGRGASAFIARCVPIQVTMSVHIVLVTLLHGFLSLFALGHRTKFVATVWLLSLVNAPIWPGMISWTNHYIFLTATAYTLLGIGTNASVIVFAPIFGSIYDSGNLDNVMHLASVFAACACLIFLMQQTLGFFQGTRFQKAPSEIAGDKGHEGQGQFQWKTGAMDVFQDDYI